MKYRVMLGIGIIMFSIWGSAYVLHLVGLVDRYHWSQTPILFTGLVGVIVGLGITISAASKE